MDVDFQLIYSLKHLQIVAALVSELPEPCKSSQGPEKKRRKCQYSKYINSNLNNNK